MIQRRLTPGHPGTKKYVKKHGTNLVCVRYRYDAEKKIKSKTVEIIVEQSHWEPDGKRIPKNKIMNIRINLNEGYLRELVKAAGGRWDHQNKLWQLPYHEVLSLGLENRLVPVENVSYIRNTNQLKPP